MTELPPLPEPDSILIGPDGDFNAYTADQMREHAAEAVRVALEQAQKDAERWRGLYRRAVNEANGLTNYVEDRPELRRAERNLTAIEAEARAIVVAAKDSA